MVHTSSFLLLVLGLSQSLKPAISELIELSYTYNEDAPTSPSLRQFKQELVKKGKNRMNVWVELYDICLSEHSGTHIDAPRHYSEAGLTVEGIPLDRLWRVPAVVVDVSDSIRNTRLKNYDVTVRDLTEWEARHGTIPDGALLLVHTGWGRMVTNTWSYAGLDQNNRLNFPGIGAEAAEWVVNHGRNNSHTIGIVGVGIDTLSLDKGNSLNVATHTTLYAANIYGLENVANLDKLPPVGAYVTVLPMKIGKGTGAPARIIAEVGEGPTSNSNTMVPFYPGLLLTLLLALLLH